VVSSVRVSRQIIYTVEFRLVSALAEFLLANCCVECAPGEASVDAGRAAPGSVRPPARATERSTS
jgi:hypothetical protein